MFTNAATTELTKLDPGVEWLFYMRNAWDTTYAVYDATASVTIRILGDVTSVFTDGTMFDIRDTANDNSNSNKAFTCFGDSTFDATYTTITTNESVANESGGSTGDIYVWTKYEYNNFQIAVKAMRPKTLTVDVPNVPGMYSDENTQSNHFQLGAEMRMVCWIGSEMEIKFNGSVKKVQPQDYDFTVIGADRLDEINFTKCKIDLVHADSTGYAPDEAEVVAAGSYRPLELVDGTPEGTLLGRVFGLVMGTPGDDEGFAEDAPYHRRSWAPGAEALWYDNAGINRVASTHYKVNHESGGVSILEGFSSFTIATFPSTTTMTFSGAHAARFPDDSMIEIYNTLSNDGVYTIDEATDDGVNTTLKITGTWSAEAAAGTMSKKYYVENLRVFWESAQSGATNCDYANVFKEAAEWSKADGGMGLTENEYDFADLGIDLASVWHFEGKVVDLWKRVRKDRQANLIYEYDSATLKFTVKLVQQGSSTTWNLLHSTSVNQGREDRDVFTRIEVTGKTELPVNILAYDGTKVDEDDAAVVTVRDERLNTATNYGTCHKWTKTNGGSDQVFSQTKRHLYDGNIGAGIGFNDLSGGAPSGEYLDGGNDYNSWFYFVTIDMGKERTIDRMRFHLPPSANPNQGHYQNEGDEAVFFPGIWVEISSDDTNYFDISPALRQRREKPGTVLDIRRDELARTTGRYIRIHLGAFKQGISNASDPSIGLMEAEIFTQEFYRITKEIDGNASPATFYIFTNSHVLPVFAVDQGADTFSIEGKNYTALFVDGFEFAVKDSTGNDAVYICDGNSTIPGSDTIIAIVGDIPHATADGSIITSFVQRNQEDLHNRYRTGRRLKENPLGNRYNEFLAHDVALLEYRESLRLFQKVNYQSVCDPRINMWDTVGVTDELNGDITSILVDDGVTFSLMGAGISGTNYRAGELGT